MHTSLGSRRSQWFAAMAVTTLALIALVRIVSTYAITPQAFDETCHVAAAIELLDRHTYTLDPVHPPLARLAIGLPLYLAGERYPKLPPLDHPVTYTDVGNAILYGNDSALGHYVRDLRVARLGVLPFFLLGAVLVFLWAKEISGGLAGVIAAALYTTTPSILAFSSIAYTDIVAASMQLWAIFAFSRWLGKPTWRSALWLGFVAGLALASKATTVMFVGSSILGIVLLWLLTTHAPREVSRRRLSQHIAVAILLACATVWATYGFSVGHVREGMNLSAEQIPSFQHFPAPVAKIARELVISNPIIPAPALVRGIGQAWVLNKLRPDAYLLGRIRAGGWWYFFLVCIAVKTPIPILLLSAFGLYAAIFAPSDGRWRALVPAVAVAAILLITLPVKYQAGSRHVLVVFLLFCIVAAKGGEYLWQSRHKWRVVARAAVVLLLAWQGVSTLRAEGDFLAYFNEFAGREPGRVLEQGCDLDCGQDLFRLADAFRARHVSQASIAVWTSSEPDRMGLPQFKVPQPHQVVTGWFAVSERAICCGAVFHEPYPPDSFGWLKDYRPVAYVGKTIRLYYIPENATGAEDRISPRAVSMREKY